LDQFAAILTYSVVLEDSYILLEGVFGFEDNSNFTVARARTEIEIKDF
jgi:hypothetical protein